MADRSEVTAKIRSGELTATVEHTLTEVKGARAYVSPAAQSMQSDVVKATNFEVHYQSAPNVAHMSANDIAVNLIYMKAAVAGNAFANETFYGYNGDKQTSSPQEYLSWLMQAAGSPQASGT